MSGRINLVMNHLTSNQRVLIDEIEAKLGNRSIMDLSEFFEMDFTGKSAVYNLLIKILFQENVLSFDDFRDEAKSRKGMTFYTLRKK